jgi:hypothetical protein
MRHTHTVKATNKFAPLSAPLSKGPKHKYLHACAWRQLNQNSQENTTQLIAVKKINSLVAERSQKLVSAHLPKFSPSTFVAFDPVSSCCTCVEVIQPAGASRFHRLWQRPHGKQKSTLHSESTKFGSILISEGMRSVMCL